LRISRTWGCHLGAYITNEGWNVVEVAGRGCCVQFGNNDVASKSWVVAQASLVILSSMSDGLSSASLCRSGVGTMVECPYENDDEQLVARRGFFRRKPSIFLLWSLSSKSELSLVGVCRRLLACG
jgi:hypothetical protein